MCDSQLAAQIIRQTSDKLLVAPRRRERTVVSGSGLNRCCGIAFIAVGDTMSNGVI